MTSDQKIQLLADLMAIREHLSDLHVRIGRNIEALASAEYAAHHSRELTHATEPMPNAALHDEPPSRPIVDDPR